MSTHDIDPSLKRSALSDELHPTDAKRQRQEEADKRRSKRIILLGGLGGALLLAKLGVPAIESGVDAVRDHIRDGQVYNMLAQPSEVVQAEVDAGKFTADEVMKFDINRGGNTSAVAQDIARDDIDMGGVQDIMVRQIGEYADPGEQVYVPTQDVDPKFLQSQGQQQPK